MTLPLPAADRALCAHCGLDVPPSMIREREAAQFCCSGCRQVHVLIHEWGLEQYYRLTARDTTPLEPARISGRAFDDFDDNAAQGEASVPLPGGRVRTRLYLEGVHCTACIWLVERLPSVLPGVNEVRLNFGSAVADVVWQPSQTRLSIAARALDRLGYTPHLHRESIVQEARRAEDRATLARLGVAAASAMNLMFVSGALYAGEFSGMALKYESFFRWFSLLIAVPVFGYSARPFFQTAIGGLRARTVHIDLPIAIGIAGGATASAVNVMRGSGPLWFDSLAMLVTALLGARQLQRSAQRAALERADSLRGVAFLEFARRLGAGESSTEVPLAALVAGDRVEVRSGELIPVDGVVLAGRSSIDNAVLTGEAVPITVNPGDAVNAGATNLGARLVVRVDAVGERTRVGALMALVQDALSRRPGLIQRTDVMARRFVYVLLATAVITGAVVWTVDGLSPALTRIVALLVVSCPCALGLSVPLAMSMTLMRAARAGIFVKNPDALERLRHVRMVLLDKTGTLTEGEPRVVRWFGDAAALELASALEGESSHPIARAFQAARTLHLVRTVSDVREVAGHGIAGRLDGVDIRVGHHAFASASGEVVPDTIDRAAQSMVVDGLSPVFVSVNGRVSGVAGVGDRLRADARATVDALKAQGLRVCVLSGDHPQVVWRAGKELGLADADVHGGLTPEAKRGTVRALKSAIEGAGAVVMVGDGVNDAAALALADVGIAVHGGTGASIVAADVVFTREGVRPVLDLLHGARRLNAVVRRNISFSLAYNATASSVAVAGLIGPLLAAVLMPVSSLVVVLSSAMTQTFAAPPPARAGKG